MSVNGRCRLRVLSPGLAASLQDTGRLGLGAFGVPPSGPLDELSFTLANALVGNPIGATALEFSLVGPRLLVEGAPCVIAVCGDARVEINGEESDAYRSHWLEPGDRLSLPRLRSGARGYLAIAGGFTARSSLGSRATLLRAGLGGLDGRCLAAGDLLKAQETAARHRMRRCDRLLPQRDRRPIRVVPGPQHDYFAPEQRERWLASEYRIGAASDRMGYRLEGPPIQCVAGHNIVSDAIATGSIQVPGSGEPIIAMHDRQSTGGYPKIATVIRADLIRLGQLAPGDRLGFEAVSVEQGEDIWRGRSRELARLLERLA
ncbi:biotin-dependent carboxyltransferase family protein [Halotalea alkalilenta]|uniref:Carboxyltransferase domain-containing protein n=1 Tax=Halotalea alkalilenta TaxID=376489 RepID=A0A172YJZ0_9GAMM|nr:biotin-dependent carboxyltransferase family protein [Halotalea alkalilenta]ANF59529.1 hypothetical protein A5892_06285 [Halotalea alkalilenta]